MLSSRFAFRLLSCVGLLLAIVAGTGCAHYQLGTGGTPSFRRLYIEPVASRTLLPQARALLSTQLRETFLRDGRVTLVNSAGEADATLTVVINDYHRDPVTAREGDTGLARKFNVTLGALCTLRDGTGKPIFENRSVTAVRETFTDGGQLQSEYQTLPLLADIFANKVAHAALDNW
jgi:hypothetical protein